MQIRLTVVDPLGPAPQRGRAASRDVLVTAPVGTELAAVASALAGAVAGDGGSGREAGGASVVLYVGTERLDPRRSVLGEPPLIDGAVLSLGAPAAPEPHPELDEAPTQLHVVAGPDAGGVHLLHGGRITVGRSAEADVPLDDPDVSRLHCAVIVAADGRVSVADLGSTNGTTLDTARVTERAVRFPPGGLLRIGESALRVAPCGGPGARMRTVADGEGCVRVVGAGSVFPPAPPVQLSSPTAGGPGGADSPSAGAGGSGGVGSAGAGGSGGAGSAAGTGRPGGAGSAEATAGGPGGAGPVAAGAGGTGWGGSASAGAGYSRGADGSAAGAGSSGGVGPAGAGGPGGAGPASAGAGSSGGVGPAGAGDPGGAGSASAGARGTGWTDSSSAGAGYSRAADGSAPTAGRTGGTGPASAGAGSSGGGAPAGAGGPGGAGSASAGARGTDWTDSSSAGAGYSRGADGSAATAGRTGGTGPSSAGGQHPRGAGAGGFGAAEAVGGAQHGYDSGGWGASGAGAGAQEHRRAAPVVPGQGGAPGIEHRTGIDTGTGYGSGPGFGTGSGSDSGTGTGFGTGSGSGSGTGTGFGTGTGTGYGPNPSPNSTSSPNPSASSSSNSTHAGRFGVAGGGAAGAARTELGQAGRRRGLGAWARRLAGGRGETAREQVYDGVPGATAGDAPAAGAPQLPETWPDPAALLLTALGPGPRLWERGPGHPEALTVRLGTADRSAPDGSGLLPSVPVTAALREAGALGLAGPRPRLSGLARAVLAQLAGLHSPDLLEIVLISADRTRPVQERTAEWSWLGWLPHVRPGHGQDCRLLLAYDREQAAARTEELLRRVEEHAATGRTTAHPHTGVATAPGTSSHSPSPTIPAQTGPAASSRRPSWARENTGAGVGGFPGPYTVVVVDGDPGGAALQESVARLAVAGPRAGIHVVCLAETEPASPASPVTRTYEAACAAAPTFRHCGAVALLGGDVATALHVLRVAPTGPVGPGTVAAVDAVSAAWAERFARALAPLRADGPAGERHARVAAPLPRSARLLDELGLARATPASLMARWADAADDPESLGGRARAVLGAGPRGPLTADLVADGPHLLIEGPPGSGRTELLRTVVASLAAAERPDRLSVVLVDGRDGVGTGAGRGEGLRVCTDIPHVTTHLIANDPVRMREFAQSLAAELKRRAELLGRTDFAQWHAGQAVSGRIVPQRTAGTGDIETPPSSTLRLRPGTAARQRAVAAPPLPRLVVVVDDLDALVSPALGSPGRPAAGSVLRALEAVAREGERLGMHLVAAAGTGGRTAETEPARRATLRIALDAPGSGPDEPAPGRGRLTYRDGQPTGFQGGRVTGRIPRTATQRPTVVPLDWERMGDPPARRPVRELGNGPTDLALLASAVERAARQVSAAEVPSLLS
ncbi:FtsK/SpoIIIE domain-containing protein [Streptomyces sp. NPDC127190]|uniref:FtsK/SpoIIIE domain-containing protein n=1 Tax=unclassified Streptomyces TaxID=2593676 RepID=UPI00363D4C4C